MQLLKTSAALLLVASSLGLGFSLAGGRQAAPPPQPTVVRYVNLNKVFELAPRFAAERAALTKRWESFNTALGEMAAQGKELEARIVSYPGLKNRQEYRDLVEELEVLGFRLRMRRENLEQTKNREQAEAILKWTEEAESVIATYAANNGIDVVLQNWENQEEEEVKLEEQYRRILYRPAAYLDPALDISAAIADLLVD